MPRGSEGQHLGPLGSPGDAPPPQAVLAAVVIVNLKGMLTQFRDVCSLWEANRTDLVRGLGAQGPGQGSSAPVASLDPVDHCPSVFSSSGW